MPKIILLCIFLAAATSSQAQRGYIERSIHRSMERKYGDSNLKKGTNWIEHQMLNPQMEAEYVFSSQVDMHITQYRNGAIREESDISYLGNPGKKYVATQQNETRRKKIQTTLSIYDDKNQSSITLNKEEKTGIAININAFRSGEAIRRREAAQNNPDSSSNNDISCKKTGKTKTIRGYSCYEYVCTDARRNAKNIFWIAPKLSFNPGTAMAQRYGQMPEGMFLEGYFYRDDELESKWEVTQVNTQLNEVVRISDYSINQ